MSDSDQSAAEAASAGSPGAGHDKVAAFVEEWDLRAAVGGVRGVVDNGLASTGFVIVYVFAGHRLAPALVTAVGVTVALLALRAVRREPLRQALSGVLAVGISAVIAVGTGRAANFFAIGILLQMVYALAYLVSFAIRWPWLATW